MLKNIIKLSIIVLFVLACIPVVLWIFELLGTLLAIVASIFFLLVVGTFVYDLIYFHIIYDKDCEIKKKKKNSPIINPDGSIEVTEYEIIDDNIDKK